MEWRKCVEGASKKTHERDIMIEKYVRREGITCIWGGVTSLFCLLSWAFIIVFQRNKNKIMSCDIVQVLPFCLPWLEASEEIFFKFFVCQLDIHQRYDFFFFCYLELENKQVILFRDNNVLMRKRWRMWQLLIEN